MAIDEALFECLQPNDPPILRFYSWERPTLSLGYFQDYKRVVVESFLLHNNIDVVRRPTGGRAVLHDKEVTYAVIANLNGVFANQTLQETYQLIASALELALQRFGITQSSISLDSTAARKEVGLPQCFVSVSKYEIASGTRKVIGSAQKRVRDRFLQHGSILLDFDARLQSGSIRNPDPEIETKIAPLNRLLGRTLPFDEVAGRFGEAFEHQFGMQLQRSDLIEHEKQTVETLELKYRSSEWTQRRCK
jgi:lipoyl(octanoyl) transferase